MPQIILTVLVVLGLPRANKALIAFVKTILAKLTGNTFLPTPTPSVATITTALTAFETSETSMGTSKGVKGDRAAKRATLVALLKHLRDFVQGACESNLENAAAIAESVGMRLYQQASRVRLLISVTQALLDNKPVSGSVVCDAKAVAPTATYFWCYSLDQKIWVSVPEQMQAKVVIAGLTPGQTYYFRFRALTRKGMGDPSQIVSLIVK
jgi:hypothetical protein